MAVGENLLAWSMAYYRCYFIDDTSHVYDFAEFDCDTDAQAIAWARRLCPARVADGFELWQQIRLVHRQERRGASQNAGPSSVQARASDSPPTFKFLASAQPGSIARE